MNPENIGSVLTQMIKTDILIIGAGLSGLLTANLLREQRPDLRLLVLEARTKPGGRIRTLRPDNAAPIEMGATWLTHNHSHLQHLLQRLRIETVAQYVGEQAVYELSPAHAPERIQMPTGQPQSYRIKGGSDRIISALAATLDEDQLICESPVQTIRLTQPDAGANPACNKLSAALQISTPDQLYTASVVISTLPPRLLTHSIIFEPALPDTFQRISSQTHTWMSDAIKAGFALATDADYSNRKDMISTLFSNSGPFTELYDQSSGAYRALVGFLHPKLSVHSPEERRSAAHIQLSRLLGTTPDSLVTYYECNWKQEVFTHSPYSGFIPPHQHNGHPVFRQPLLQGRLILSGTETASIHPGYMEGAVESAIFAADSVAAIF